MKRLLLFLVLVCQMVFAPLQAGAAAQVPPRPTASIYVQDQAGVLSRNTRDTISAYSTALARKTKAQIVVLTVPSLRGQSLEDYSLTVLRQWGIGGKAGSKWGMAWKGLCPTDSPAGSRIRPCCPISGREIMTGVS